MPAKRRSEIPPLLGAVREAQELRAMAERAFADAVVRAKTRHSYSEIGEAAGLARTAIRYIILRERGELPSRAKPKEEEE